MSGISSPLCPPPRGGVRRPAVWLLLLLALSSLGWTQTQRVARIIDGDTFHLEDGRSVRLLGIDTPETGKYGQPDGYYAREATRALRDLIADRSVTIRTAGEPKDSYGRVLALVEVPGRGLVNEIMLREGYGWYYYHLDHDPALSRRLLAAQQEAMEQGRGLWPGLARWSKNQGPMIGNKRSRRFFPAQHPDVQRIAPRNRIAFPGMVEALRAGFAPARHAVSWPSAR